MARPQVYKWLPQDLSAVCALQSIAAPGNLLMNGTEVSQGAVSFGRVFRSVGIETAAPSNLIAFTITGTYGNIPVSETRSGPAVGGNVVYTTQLFSTVTSVVAHGAVANVRIASGHNGISGWFNFNYHCAFSALTVAISNVSGVVSLSGATTLDDVNTNMDPYLFDGIVLSAANGEAFGSCLIPISYATITVAASTGGFTATFLQQGIT